MNHLVVILILFSKRKKLSELDTKELKYPSSDEENYSSDTDSDQFLPDLTNLKAFDFELTCAPL